MSTLKQVVSNPMPQSTQDDSEEWSIDAHWPTLVQGLADQITQSLSAMQQSLPEAIRRRATPDQSRQAIEASQTLMIVLQLIAEGRFSPDQTDRSPRRWESSTLRQIEHSRLSRSPARSGWPPWNSTGGGAPCRSATTPNVAHGGKRSVAG